MKPVYFIPRLIVFCFLLSSFCGCVLLKGKISTNIDIKKEPKKELPIIEPKRTYTEMLGKGYARIGSVDLEVKSNLYSEKRAEKDLVKEAKKCGAEIIWTNIYTSIHTEQTRVVENVSEKYVTGFGKPYKETTYKYGTGYKDVKETSGTATLFAYDPELASKQLIDGKKKWEEEAAKCKKIRDILLTKLERIKKILETLDPSTLLESTSHYILNAESAINELKTGDFRFIEGELISLYHGTMKDGTLFKNQNDPKRVELEKLTLDTESIYEANSIELYDVKILDYPEHILFR